MQRLALFVLVGSIIVAVWHIDRSVSVLPEQVATHFGSGGVPDGWMTRGGYRVFMLLFVTLLPLFVAALAGGLPRLFPNATNIPNRQMWMAPERREQTLRFLTAHAYWLGCLMVAFVLGIHLLVIEANQRVPPRLPERAFFIMLGAFVLSLTAWILLMVRRFRRPA